MSDKYIRKEDAIRLAEQGQVQGFPWQFQMLLRLPSADVVPVVRCKDCLFFTTEKLCCRPEGLIKASEDDFCSHGERREE